jgi:hypothetical protein
MRSLLFSIVMGFEFLGSHLRLFVVADTVGGGYLEMLKALVISSLHLNVPTVLVQFSVTEED